MELIDIGYGCFVARFSSRRDYLHVLIDGPWKVFDNYLVAQRWVPQFDPSKAKLAKMVVWVRLPKLFVEYFRDDIIKKILNNVGKPLKLDRTTTAVTKGRFARAAVEIDLDKPLVSEIWVNDLLHEVEYEGLHVLCFGCGIVGHRQQTCPHSKAPSTPADNTMDLNAEPVVEKDVMPDPAPAEQPPPTETARAKYGPWMVVTRKRSVEAAKKNHNQTKSKNAAPRPKGNQFQSLSGLKESSKDNRQSSTKNNQKKKNGENGKCKSSNPAPSHPSTPYVQGISVTPIQRAAQVDRVTAQRSSGQVGGGRGGSRTTFRGGTRIAGRRGTTDNSISFDASSFAPGESSGLGASASSFQFGGLNATFTGFGFGNSGLEYPAAMACFTPGEGGCQTSLPTDISQ
ncbi:PREDICTED: uncharacterized protein LOC109164759 [Ipomoea nil]|uniref:uncharacterized protein LOC109164759 n=1 Tax=Ipomoea nil TaxID=35883 RepID=UPI0009018F79|nr:PREDICTED: uncharacterized protein LOC109164759 [Ipomoea nil]